MFFFAIFCRPILFLSKETENLTSSWELSTFGYEKTDNGAEFESVVSN